MDQLTDIVGTTDIYLLDQILKGRYGSSGAILDVGAGPGRNLRWFVRQGFDVFGTDLDPAAVDAMRRHYPGVPRENFQVASAESLPFPDEHFDHVVCCAVLHFARNPANFEEMFGELIRVLKPGGSLFARVATDVGLAEKMIPLGDGRFTMPDGTDRFLLTRSTLDALLSKHQLRMLEPFKTVLVDEVRSMTALVIAK
jgi:SAM-dependent methyltransferase